MARRVLVVDDDREIVRLMCAYLERSGYEVLIADNGETALHMLRRDRPDLMLLDLMLPARDGLDFTHEVGGDSGLAAMPIIMLTASVEDPDKIVGSELGADDYVSQPFSPGEVVARVQAVLRRAQGEIGQSSILQCGNLVMDLDRHQVEVAGTLVQLTPTEFSLLRTLAEQPGHALTRLEMIDKGLGYNYEGLERTVDSHVKNLRHKLEKAGGAAKAIETVFGVGYRLTSIDPAGACAARNEGGAEATA